MNDRQEQHLDVLSQMDERIVEEVTLERYERGRWLARRKRVRWISIIASAACFFLLLTFGGGILRLIGGKQIPVYEGMTVASEYAGTPQESLGWATVKPMLQFAAGDGQETEPPKEPPKLPHDSKPIEEVVESTLQVEGSGEPPYYAKPNQDIYITVHINNPDKFEILSFTLNGEKYSSYMFEEGSDMEHLVLKVNVGDRAPCEILTYTIDAIKYIDGTEIKDVRMEGDDTVQVGIAPDVTVTEKIGTQTLSLTLTPREPHASSSENQIEIYAVLYDGKTLINKKKISLTDVAVTVSFEGLDEKTTYQYGIVALYHVVDGEKTVTYVLKEKTVSTLPFVEFTDVSRDHHSLNFRLQWYGENTGTSLALYQEDTFVRELSMNDTVVDALKVGTPYRLVLTYTDGDAVRTVELEIPIYGYSPVKNGEISKEYSPLIQLFNQTTMDYRLHLGCDITATDDPNVYAVAGRIVEIMTDGILGKLVAIETANGDTFYYKSLGSIADGLSVGQSVSFGQVIGTVGNTLFDEVAESPHLHLEIIAANGKTLDPGKYMNG